MKTNIKIELALLGFVTLLSLIFQVHVKSVSNSMSMEEIELSATLTTSNITLEPFSTVYNNIDIPVELHAGDAKIEIKTDNQLFEVLDIKSDEGKLIIDYKESTNKRGSDQLMRASSIKIYTNEAVKEISLRHNAKIKIIDAQFADNLNLQTSGNSNLRGNVMTQNLDVSTSGNSLIELSGETTDLEANSSGNSHIELVELKSRNATIRSSGNSGGEVYAQDFIDAKISGNSHINVHGKPDKSQIVSSGNSHVNIEE